MEAVSDVVVVGGGPCGSSTALNLAKHGCSVTVFEEHGEIGIPSHCAGHLGINGLRQLGLYPLPAEIIENTFYGAVFYSPKGHAFSVRFPSAITCTVDRVLFDRYLAQKAEDAGANYCLNSHVDSLIVEDGFVKGVLVKQRERIEKKLARIVIDAEGISSRILKEVGLAAPSRQMVVSGVEAEVEDVEDAEQDRVEVFLGNYYAPGFFAWLIPKNDGKAKIGLATKHANPKMLLQRFMFKHPVASRRLRGARILRTTFHPITLGGPIAKSFSNGFLAVGDVASQVKPTTGGGIIFGLTCAQTAAEVAHKALVNHDFSERFLSEYQRSCEEALGFDVRIMRKIRKTLDAMSDEKLDDMIVLCGRLGLDKALQGVKDIDFQGPALMHVLHSPRVFPALGFFFLAYLSTNL